MKIRVDNFQLTAAHQSAVGASKQEFEVTLKNNKKYLVTIDAEKNDPKISRNFHETSRWSRIKTKICAFFGTRNRDRIREYFMENSHKIKVNSVALNEGFEKIGDQKNLPKLMDFKSVCFELSWKHAMRKYATSINPNNMGHSGNGVMFIDQDFKTRDDHSEKIDTFGTKEFLKDGNINNSSDQAYKNRDDFAMLRTMMWATGSAELKEKVGQDKLQKGIIGFHRTLVEAWVRENIHKEHQDDVLSFIADSSTNSLKQNLNTIVNWTQSADDGPQAPPKNAHGGGAKRGASPAIVLPNKLAS